MLARSGGLVRVLAIAAIATGSVARAEPPRPTKINVPAIGPTSHEVSSRLIYMRRCGIAGCTVKSGAEDSRIDSSSIADGTRTIGQFKQGDMVWAGVMACVKATYAPFNIEITDVDPGTLPHYEHIVGGKPIDLRDDLAGAGGVAPFSCNDISNAITFTFDVYGPDVDTLCWTAAQETAHAFGLEHELNAADPLTYLGGPLPKRFQPTDSPCGEYVTRPCECGGPTQNSYQHILAMFGAGAPTPPTVVIKSPSEGKAVQPHFTVRLNVTDDLAVERVELWIDGSYTGVKTAMAPFWLSAPDLEPGPHAVEARAYDIQGTPGSATVEVELGPPCTATAGCSDGDVCVMGQCVPGPGIDGGLGSPCQTNFECLSARCQSDTSGDHQCVESCDLSPGSCPRGFSCVADGMTGVCWASPDDGGCTATTTAPWPVPVAIGGLWLVVLRRRRRRDQRAA